MQLFIPYQPLYFWKSFFPDLFGNISFIALQTSALICSSEMIVFVCVFFLSSIHLIDIYIYIHVWRCDYMNSWNLFDLWIFLLLSLLSIPETKKKKRKYVFYIRNVCGHVFGRMEREYSSAFWFWFSFLIFFSLFEWVLVTYFWISLLCYICAFHDFNRFLGSE